MKWISIASKAALALATTSWASPTQAPTRRATNTTSDCDRKCMTQMVSLILDSMVAHDTTILPLAQYYKATENSHPAAITMMTSWRTITKTGVPTLLAIDVTNGTAGWVMDISEGNDALPNVMRGRVKIVNQEITELELFINRFRGDHGFSFNATELPTNYGLLMSPPANRTRATRAELEELSRALFYSPEIDNLTVAIGDDCQFSEIGWRVVDPGPWMNGSTDPLRCSWPSSHPVDNNARVGLVIDEELGLVITSGIIPGLVFGYANVSAFIPNTIVAAQTAQYEWLADAAAAGYTGLLTPMAATGETLEVLQYYDGALQAMQINVYLSGPNMTSPWL